MYDFLLQNSNHKAFLLRCPTHFYSPTYQGGVRGGCF